MRLLYMRHGRNKLPGAIGCRIAFERVVDSRERDTAWFANEIDGIFAGHVTANQKQYR